MVGAGFAGIHMLHHLRNLGFNFAYVMFSKKCNQAYQLEPDKALITDRLPERSPIKPL